jgi:GAF domain-containing protein/DNA-binding CsgD family transcriptional regulator
MRDHGNATRCLRTSSRCAERYLAESDRIIAKAGASLTRAKPNAEAILRAAVDVLAEARPAIWVASLTTSDPSVMRIIGQAENTPSITEYLGERQRRGLLPSAPVSARVIESGEPLFIPSMCAHDFIRQYLGEPDISDLQSRRLPAELGVLVVPMRASGAIIGTLGMYVPDPSDKISEGDVAWLQVVADQAALAVEHARLADEAKHYLLRLTGLGNLVHAITSTHDLSLVLNILVDRVAAIVRVDACDLLLVDEADNTFGSAASRGFRSTAMGELRLSIDNPLLNQALDSGRVEYLRSAGVLDNARRRSVFAREGFAAYAAWPLISQGKLLGALEVFHRSDLSLDMESSLLITCVADIGAAAVHMAGLHQEVLDQHRTRGMGHSLDLSQTDRRVLHLVVEGLTNCEIGAQLHLSANTVKFHVRKILDKSGAANRTDLTRRAIREGWV